MSKNLSLNGSMKIRLIQGAEVADVLRIYAPYVQSTAASFEYEIPSREEFAKRVEHITAFYPWLVAEVNGKAAGYAYACSHRSRTAYQWSAECSVYIAEEYHRLGIGKALYQRLFEILRLQGIINLYAGITLPNEKSESFHVAMGFEPVGIYRKVGYKFGCWHDVLWMVLSLQAHTDNPAIPVSIKEIEKLSSFIHAFVQ